MKQGRYRIQTVTQRTGIASATLRAWERRYGFPQPTRSASSAYRLYSELDIQQLLEIKAMCERGYSPSEAVVFLQSQEADALPMSSEGSSDDLKSSSEGSRGSESSDEGSDEGSRGSDKGSESSEGSPEEGKPTLTLSLHPTLSLEEQALTQAREGLLSAIRRFDPHALERAARSALLIGSGRRVFHEVFSPVLAQVGEEWHQGTLDIAQEHLASEVIGSVSRELLRAVQPEEGPRVLLACVQDEQHVLSLYGSAFYFAQWGCQVSVLGANTPPSAIKVSCERMQPALVGLSITQEGPLLATLLPQYAQACGDVSWVVGGYSAKRYQAQIESLGGQLAANTPQALKAQLKALLP